MILNIWLILFTKVKLIFLRMASEELFHWQRLEWTSHPGYCWSLLISIRKTIVKLNYLSSKKYTDKIRLETQTHTDWVIATNLFYDFKSILIVWWQFIVKPSFQSLPPPTISINCKVFLITSYEYRKFAVGQYSN